MLIWTVLFGKSHFIWRVGIICKKIIDWTVLFAGVWFIDQPLKKLIFRCASISWIHVGE